MKKHNIKQSISKPGCPFDNAVGENMFKLPKIEGIDQSYKYEIELIEDVDTWVSWYNKVRIRSKIAAIYRGTI